MSYAAFKMMHWATGIEHCAAGFITHSAADSTPRIAPITSDDMDSDWATSNKTIGSLPNLITVAANVIEVYTVRIQDESSSSLAHKAAAEPKGGAVLAGISGASLELACHYRFLLIFYLIFKLCFSFNLDCATWIFFVVRSCIENCSPV